jgi:hypothetical protein
MDWVLNIPREQRPERHCLTAASYGCPLVDCYSLGRPFGQPRLQFYPFARGDGFAWLPDDILSRYIPFLRPNPRDSATTVGETSRVLKFPFLVAEYLRTEARRE